MNAAIIVAAGSGQRFGGDVPKQFLEISGKPLLIHTLERFENCAAIDEIVLVLSSDQMTRFLKIAEKFKIKKLEKIISGGKTRAESVFQGIKAIEKAEVIAVHDGARPLVICEEITQTIEKARETGAACLVGKVTDTIKEISGERILKTIDREHLRRALTPQCFRFDILKKAFENADLSESATDECFLVEKLGYEIAFVEGSAGNIKVTTKEDFDLAELYLKLI